MRPELIMTGAIGRVSDSNPPTFHLRTDLINYFIKLFNYKSYLEIGVMHVGKNFNKIECEDKVGVDPNGKTTFTGTSDEFFQQNEEKFDIIFIDGLHEATQVKRDILNSLKHLNKNGTIVCHDVSPLIPKLLSRDACHNAWEAFAELRCERDDLEMYTLPFDHCGFIRFGNQKRF